ncbi:MAG: DUF2848 domain-containing protein [Pseudolabrys sp.]|nr:DUF2848 domain-containing protein [Pseudolabrys sp.]
MRLELMSRDGSELVDVTPGELIIAGWTGRDAAALEKHMAELEELGVRRPSQAPIFYASSVSRLVVSDLIEVLGDSTSGEAEFVLLQRNGVLWVGLGSDHTDRELEAHSVAASKQICDKPIARQFWRYDDVAPHWDALLLRSYATNGGQRALYQDGGVAQMRGPADLIARYASSGLPDNAVMFCGTVAVIGGIRPAERFECELEDPKLGRKLSFGYRVRCLPVRN